MSGIGNQAQAVEANPEPFCDHVCLLRASHVDEGRPHFYGYRLGPGSLSDLAAEVERLRGISAALFEELVVKDQAIEDIQKALDEGTWPGETTAQIELLLADLSARLDQDNEAQSLIGDEGEQQQ